MYNRMFFLSFVLIGTIGVLFLSVGILRGANKSKNAAYIYPMHAWLDNDKVITAKLSMPLPNNKETIDNSFKIVNAEGKGFEIIKITPMLLKGEYTDLLEIELKEPLVVDKLYFLESGDYNKAAIVPRHVLDNKEYFYAGDDLGAVYGKEKTGFRIWAPTALSVSIMIYDYYNSDLTNLFLKQALSKDVNGTWKTAVEENLNNKYYLYEIELYVDGKITKYRVTDPYSRGSAVDCMKTLIFDPEDINRGVSGWDLDACVLLKQNVDAIIYELHVRDFTISSTSGTKPEYKGKYLGLAQRNTLSAKELPTGLDHIKGLGVTHVHLLPTFDYGIGDEAEMNNSYTWYNWGYDPVLYNNVEGSYSTNPNGIIRQTEYKKMVQAFHEDEIGVIFDAVFNHTFQTGDKKLSIFDKIVPYYFYRVKDDGTYSNGSSCGNEVATERPMVRKFIVDSVKYFTKEYHIDGFRFDLMGLIDKQTMLDVYKEVKTLNPNAIIYGEGWKMSTILPVEDCMTQVNVKESGIAAFNDGIRDNLKGDAFKKKSKGFVHNVAPMAGINRLENQIKGQETGCNKDPIPVASPNATVNYVSCHDNLCLWDKLVVSNPKAGESNSLRGIDGHHNYSFGLYLNNKTVNNYIDKFSELVNINSDVGITEVYLNFNNEEYKNRQTHYTQLLNKLIKLFHAREIKVYGLLDNEEISKEITTNKIKESKTNSTEKNILEYNNYSSTQCEFDGISDDSLGTKNLSFNNSNSAKLCIRTSYTDSEGENTAFSGNSWEEFFKEVSDIISVSKQNKRFNGVIFSDFQELQRIWNLSLAKIKRMDLLAFGAVITSQGIPFFAEGDDFGRTRHYTENSYDNNDPTVNPINWSLKSKNYDMFKFYKGMIKLRKAHPAFRMYTKEMVDKHLDFIYKTSDSMIAYTIKDNANGDTWKNILVVLNSSPDDQIIELVGQWEIVVLGDKAGTEMIKIDTDKITVPGISILVAHTEDKLFTCQLEP